MLYRGLYGGCLGVVKGMLGVKTIAPSIALDPTPSVKFEASYTIIMQGI